MTEWWKLLVYAGYVLAAWLVFRVAVRREYQTKGKLRAGFGLLETAVFFLHGILSYQHLPAAVPYLPRLAPRPVLNVVAFILIAIGLVGVFTAMTRLGYGVSVGQEAGGVRRSGMYAVSRNPQIVSYTLVVIGFALLWPNWLGLAWVTVYLITAHWMVKTEEEYLLAKYGQEFTEYCQATPRYLW